MGEFLAVVLEGLVELLIELLIYIGIDLRWKRDDGRAGCGYVLAFLVLGAGLGALANLVHPRLLMPTEAQRVAALLAGPVFAGGVSWFVARYRQTRSAGVVPGNHFITAFCFVLAFDVVRYAYGTH